MTQNKHKLIYIVTGIVIVLITVAIALPSILNSFGFHPDFEGKQYQLRGKKALIVTTSHGVLNKPGETEGNPTGVFGSEMTIPYYEFLDAKMRVDVASIKGGEIPIDPSSFLYFIKEDADKRYLEDDIFKAKVKNSIPLKEVDFKEYDVVFFAGGWGAAYDMAQSELLAEKVSEAYYNSDVLYGSVCHGALAFAEAKDSTGNYLIKDRTMTGVTQKQLDQLGIEFTPKHPETELIKAGANFQANHKRMDFFATLTVVDEEKRFITGQNQNSGHETSQMILELLSKHQK
ncbi:MAG: type 1 glutamine amidotransferase domain-containing protein [Bacteroidota bacterium]